MFISQSLIKIINIKIHRLVGARGTKLRKILQILNTEFGKYNKHSNGRLWMVVLRSLCATKSVCLWHQLVINGNNQNDIVLVLSDSKNIRYEFLVTIF